MIMFGYTRGSIGLDRDNLVKVITVCQNIADSFDEGVGIDAIIINFFKALDLVHDRLLTKLAASDGDSRLLEWVRELIPWVVHKGPE